MTAVYSDLNPYLVLILVGFLPNEVWRLLGFAVARGLNEDSEIVIWVRAIATAALGAVIAQVLFFPPGALASIPLAVRIAAMLIGLAAFLIIRRSVLAGVIAGEGVLLAGRLLFAP